MSGGSSSSACGGSTGVKVGNITGSPTIKYATGAVHTGSIHCKQGAKSTGGSGSATVSLPGMGGGEEPEELLQNLQVNSVISNGFLQNLQPITIDNNGLQNMQVNSVISNGFLQQLGSGPVTIDNNHLQNMQVNSVIDNGFLQNLQPITIDNNGLQNMIRLGPVFADAGKAAGHSVLDSLNGSFLQNMQVNSVISNGF